jgi:hypothetical protein
MAISGIRANATFRSMDGMLSVDFCNFRTIADRLFGTKSVSAWYFLHSRTARCDALLVFNNAAMVSSAYSCVFFDGFGDQFCSYT